MSDSIDPKKIMELYRTMVEPVLENLNRMECRAAFSPDGALIYQGTNSLGMVCENIFPGPTGRRPSTPVDVCVPGDDSAEKIVVFMLGKVCYGWMWQDDFYKTVAK